MRIKRKVRLDSVNKFFATAISAVGVVLGSLTATMPQVVMAESEGVGGGAKQNVASDGLLAIENGSQLADESGGSGSPAVWLQVSPVSQKVSLSAGKTLDYVFNVSNIGSSKFSFHVYTAPYTIIDEDYNVDFSKETQRTQLSHWITFKTEDGTFAETASYTVDVNEKKQIEYRVQVPSDVPDGGEYATIFAESDASEGEASSSGIKTVSRVGMIVYGSTDGNTVDAAEIAEANVPTFMTSGDINAVSKVKNSGNTDFEATYQFTVNSLFGKELYSRATTYQVLPDTVRKVNMDWESSPMMGFFQVKYSVKALDKTQEVSRIVIILPVFVIVLGIILLTLIIVWIIILIRKRRERESRLLV